MEPNKDTRKKERIQMLVTPDVYEFLQTHCYEHRAVKLKITDIMERALTRELSALGFKQKEGLSKKK